MYLYEIDLKRLLILSEKEFNAEVYLQHLYNIFHHAKGYITFIPNLNFLLILIIIDYLKF